MKSPICYLCNKDFGSEFFHFQTGGALVRFADYRPLPQGAAGHPYGLEWFCNQHLQAAQALAWMSVSEALAALQDEFGEFPAYQAKPHCDPELWVISVGPHPEKVFAILRQASQVSPAEAKKLLMSGTFMVARGWPRDFRGWQAVLVEAEAEIEIRCP